MVQLLGEYYVRVGVALLVASWVYGHGLWLLARNKARYPRRIRVRRDSWATWTVWVLSVPFLGILVTPQAAVVPSPRVAALGLLMMVGGNLLLTVARHQLGRYWSVYCEVVEGHRWFREGLYARMDHPIYTGEFVVLVGGLLLSGHLLALPLALVLLFLLLVKLRNEEGLLLEYLGPRPALLGGQGSNGSLEAPTVRVGRIS